MAEEALRLRVDKNIYQTTLNNLDAQLGNLKSYRDELKKQIERLESGNTFSGTDVKVAIEKAKEALEKVNDAISRVTGQRMAIQQQLTGVEQAAAQLSGDMAAIDLPNMFG